MLKQRGYTNVNIIWKYPCYHFHSLLFSISFHLIINLNLLNMKLKTTKHLSIVFAEVVVINLFLQLGYGWTFLPLPQCARFDLSFDWCWWIVEAFQVTGAIWLQDATFNAYMVFLLKRVVPKLLVLMDGFSLASLVWVMCLLMIKKLVGGSILHGWISKWLMPFGFNLQSS